MHRLRSSIAWLTLVAGVSAAACTFDLREEPVQGPATATEPADDEASAADTGSGSTTGSNAKADGGDAGVTVTCYADEDGDGYPDSSSSITASGSCPAPYVPTRADAKFDCDDDDSDVHPGQKAYFSKPSSAGTYDYDCDGTSTLMDRPVLYCTVLPPTECASAVAVSGFNVATISAVGCGSKVKGIRCGLSPQGTCMYSSAFESDVQFTCR